MSRRTLFSNSLILSLGCFLTLAIAAYLLRLNALVSPKFMIAAGALLFVGLAIGFALYLRKRFGSRPNIQSVPQTVLVNETWLLKQ